MSTPLSKIIGMDLKLSETVKAIRKSKHWTQRAMAAEIKVDFQDIQRAENAGRNLEKQFALFLKLLPLIEAQDLKSPSDGEVLAHVKDDDDPTAPKDVSKETVRNEKTIARSIPSRKSKGNRRW